MENYKSYKIICYETTKLLEENVMDYLSMGWKLVGGICVVVSNSGTLYYQAVAHHK
jgi:hypothetical protein